MSESENPTQPSSPRSASTPLILIHGGAGTLFRGEISPKREAAAREGLWAALKAGMAMMANSRTSLDAVEAAVKVLEDCEVFNAGKGSVYTHQGTQEMDAAIMDGRNRSAGAVAGVSRIRNPISLARQVMEQSPHVFLVGTGAEAFAQEQGCEFAPVDYFYSDYRWQQLLSLRDGSQTALDHAIGVEATIPETFSDLDPEHKYGTVGAVALDAAGNLAAATSTGGMTNKRSGRVGDSPIIGSGTYADNASCAVSATGHGEFMMRTVIGHDVAARMRYGGLSLVDAVMAAMTDLNALGGAGGLIALDAKGNWAMPYNTGRMYRGWLRAGSEGEVEIY